MLLTALLLPASGVAVGLRASMTTADAVGNVLDQHKPDARRAHRRLLAINTRYMFSYRAHPFCKFCLPDRDDQ